MLIRQTLLTLPAQIAGPLAMLAAAVVWTHFLPPSELGLYAIVWAVQDAVYLATLTWWSAYIQRYAAAVSEAGSGSILDATDFSVQALAVLAQIALAFVAVTGVFGLETALALAAPMSVFVVARSVTTVLAVRARATLRNGPYTMLQTSGPLLGLLLGLGLAQVWPLNAALLIWIYAIAHAAGILAVLPFLGLSFGRLRLEPAMLKPALLYGGPLILSSLCEWTGVHAVRFIVEAFAGAAAVGLITAGWWLGIRLAVFAANLVNGAAFAVAVNARHHEGDEAARSRLAASATMTLALLLPTVTGGALLAHELSAFLVAEPYRAITEAILPMALAAGALKAFREHSTDQALLIFERVGASALTAVVEGVVTIIGAALGLWLGGLTGAIAGCLVAAAFSQGFSFVLAVRYCGYRLDYADLLRLILATGLMAGAVLLLPRPVWGSGLAVPIIAGAAVYALALAALFAGRLRSLAASLRPDTMQS